MELAIGLVVVGRTLAALNEPHGYFAVHRRTETLVCLSDRPLFNLLV